MRYVTYIVSISFAALLAGCGLLDDFGDPFHNAAYRGDSRKVENHLRAGVDVDRRTEFGDYTALILAGYTPYTNIVAMLLEHGADVNAQDRGGMTALHCAAYRGQADTAQLLIQSGADLSVTNAYGFTPLREAVGRGHPELVDILLHAGAAVSVQDKRGWQPLHVALRAYEVADDDRLSIVASLLDHGADPNALNPGGWEAASTRDSHIGFRPRGNPNRGNTPLAIARSNGFADIVALLESRGAIE